MRLLQMSVMGSVLIVLTMLLRRLVGDKLPPGCYLVLWSLAGVRLLLPVMIASPFSVYQLLQKTDSNDVTVFYEPMIPDRLQEMHTVVQPIMKELLFPNILTILWFCGVIVCFGVIAMKHWRNRVAYTASLPVENDFILNWRRYHKLYRKYQICICQQIITPLTYGVIRPVILLPANQSISNEDLHMVLLHEWNHIRHFDILWQWILVIICSIHWFNPLVWMMFVLCRQDIELFCDQATVKFMEAKERSAYAYLLLRQADTCREVSLFSHFCFTGYHKMEERIKLIMKQKPFSRKILFITTGLLCVGVLCFGTTAMGEVNSDINIEIAQQNEGTKMVWPIQSNEAVLTLRYGEHIHPISKEIMKVEHICIGGVEKGTDIIASGSGVVKETGFDTVLGNYVVLQYEKNVMLRYWHCEEVLVTEGKHVDVYDKIATVGQTGDATGPCLSIAMYQNGEAVDPMLYMDNAVMKE